MNKLNERPERISRKDTLLSSVGFHTLSKRTSASSSQSTQTSKSTLSRLFQKDHYQNAFQDNFGTSRAANDKRDPDAQSSQRFKSRFFTPGFLKPKSKRQPDFAQSPVDCISSETSDESLRDLKYLDLRLSHPDLPLSENSYQRHIYSPTVGYESISESKSITQKSSKQIGVKFSSQKSNSILLDPRLASLLYFTQTDQTEEIVVPSLDAGKFLEFHQRYLTSADHFIQSKLLKSASDDDVSQVGGRLSSHTVELQQISMQYETTFTKIFEMVRMILCPSKIISLPNGHELPLLEYSLDRIMRFVEDELCNPQDFRVTEPEFPTMISRQSLSENKFLARTLNSASTASTSQYEVLDFRVDEILRNVQLLFSKSLAHFAADLEYSSMASPVAPKTARHSTRQELPLCAPYVDRYLQQWIQIERAWQYFHLKIRFHLLNSLFFLQKRLRQVRESNPKYQDNSLFDFDRILTTAFKTQFIIPQLNQRHKELEKQGRGLYKVAHELYHAEVDFFLRDACARGIAVAIFFGIIATQTRRDFTSAEELSMNDSQFCDFHIWLNKLVRSPTH